MISNFLCCVDTVDLTLVPLVDWWRSSWNDRGLYVSRVHYDTNPDEEHCSVTTPCPKRIIILTDSSDLKWNYSSFVTNVLCWKPPWIWVVLFLNIKMTYVVRILSYHDDVINWRHLPRYWPFVRRIHRPPMNSPHKGQWRGALMFSLICAWTNGWVNNWNAGDLRRHPS